MAAASSEELPAQLGRYTLMRRLGIGGMSEVFEAVQDGPAGFEKAVVVKRLLPHVAESPTNVEMFLREARIAGNLHHPNIVQVYELGEVGGRFFIAMELVEGLTLHSLARRLWKQRESVPLELVAQAISDAAIGLQYAHALKGADGVPLELVHRDISPDNLIIDRLGTTKLLDFGIAKGKFTDPVTKTGDVKGKIPYMPPELLQDSAFDRRGDLWALGVSLYWLLCARRPFVGETDLKIMQAIIGDDATPPSAHNDAVPPELDEITLRLLAKDPADRPQSGGEVAEALKPFLAEAREELAAVVTRAKMLPTPEGKVDITGLRAAVPTTDKRGERSSNPTSSGSFAVQLEELRRQAEVSGSNELAPGPPATDDEFDALLELEAAHKVPWAAIAVGLVVALAIAIGGWFALRADPPAEPAPAPAPAAKASLQPPPAAQEPEEEAEPGARPDAEATAGADPEAPAEARPIATDPEDAGAADDDGGRVRAAPQEG
jgi:serine/threonine-protein kinase